MFARFDENPAMTLQDIKETKRYGRTDARTHGQRENSIPTTNKVCGGYNNHIPLESTHSLISYKSMWSMSQTMEFLYLISHMPLFSPTRSGFWLFKPMGDNYTPTNFVCGGHTVFMSVCQCVHP